MALHPDKIALCWPNYIDTAVVNGGQWVNTLPLERVQDARFSVVAKTASLDPVDTQFSITLPKRQRLHGLAIAAHNMTSTAQVRARIYRDAEQTDLIYDTDWQNVWLVLYGLDDVVWGDDNFWNRRLSEDDRQNYTPLMTLLFAERLLGTSVHVELLDPSNPAGAIIMGRVMLTDVWQPRKNLDWGVQHGYDTGTEITRAGDAARTGYASRVTPKRTVNFQLSNLNEDEAFLRIHRLQRTQDIVGEILYLWSPVPSAINFSRTMIAQQTELNGITHPYHANYEHAMSLLEIL
ncbi:hypothetical protein AAG584_19050 [Vreelandella titanicae]|uniref:Uncharacterized protein n=1 Tax=Vreelandella titanicae TaxID=664683 RepID=A0AAP9T0J2_9GAMM|nr:hypothetical protein [Halomonas titanicae]QKS24799.1 hypothetical protein FX987_02581 [Halomonas titanicae]